MEKRVVAAVSSSLPSPTMAGATAAPIVGIEGLNFLGVSVSDSVKAALPRNPYRKKWRRFKQRLRQAFMRREKYRKG